MIVPMAHIRYQDIFVPGGFPRHTYNPRVELQLEAKLAEAKENLCKLVTVTGKPSPERPFSRAECLSPRNLFGLTAAPSRQRTIFGTRSFSSLTSSNQRSAAQAIPWKAK